MSRVSQEFSVCFQGLPVALGGSTQHTRDMANDSKLIKTLDRMVEDLGDKLATVVLGHNPRLGRQVRDEQIRKWVDTYRADTDAKLDAVIVPAAAKHFRVSKRTVWKALKLQQRAECCSRDLSTSDF